MNSDSDRPHEVSQDETAESGDKAPSASFKETSASNAGVGVGRDVHGDIKTTYIQIGIGEIIGANLKNKKMKKLTSVGIIFLVVIFLVLYYKCLIFCQWVPGEVLYSDFHEMYVGEIYSFGASVALNDSIESAKKTIPTGIKIGGDDSTESIDGGETEFGNDTKIGNETMKVSKSAKLILTGDDPKTFAITPKTPEVLGITDNNPGHNYATWLWLVKPLKTGPYTLYLYAYSVEKDGILKQFDSKIVPIKVIVAPAQSIPPVFLNESRNATFRNETSLANETSLTNVTEPAENVTGALIEAPAEEAVPVVVEPIDAVEEPGAEAAHAAENATAPAAEAQPGFESIFVITGLLAVAYLVLGRRE